MELIPYGSVYDAYTSYVTHVRHPNEEMGPKSPMSSLSFSGFDSQFDENSPKWKAAMAIGQLNYRIRICLDTARALEYMHSLTPPIIHRDVRSPNILIASVDRRADVVAKLSDFGTARVLVTAIASRDLGNPFWLAPEVSV